MEIKKCNNNKTNVFIPLCWEDSVTTYCETVGYNCSNAFAGYWNFSYNRGHELYGNRIEMNHHMFQLLGNYCGIDMSVIECKGITKILEEIEQNLNQNKPTILHCDTYYSYWGSLYLQTHTKHLALACGINYDEKKVLIVEPGIPDKIFDMDFDIIEKACNFYFAVNKSNFDYLSADDTLKDIITKETFIDLSKINLIRQFASDINFLDYKKEFREPFGLDEVLNSKIMENIRVVLLGRNMFIVFLESLNKDNKANIEEITKLLKISISKWSLITQLLIKSACTFWINDIGKKLSKIIFQIADIEEEAYQKLRSVIYDNNMSGDIADIIINSRDMYYADISSYYNNKGIAKGEDDSVADLTQVGEYILLDQIYKHGIITIDNITFKLSVLDNLDNIICDGQLIYINPQISCKGVALLCCSEWGNNFERLEIEDINGNIFNYIVKANDIAVIDEKEAICVGKSISKSTKLIVREKAAFTVNQIFFKNNIDIKSILLPYCPNMHVFCITCVY